MIDVTDIEKKIDKIIAAPVPIESVGTGLTPRTWGEAMEAAKMMAVSGAAVPPYLRNNPGGCLAICFRALRWGMDPFAVAEKSYLVNNRGQDSIGFESQLIHAVVLSLAPLKGRLRSEIVGTGDDRRCHVWGTFKGETKPHEYTSETLGKKVKDIGYRQKDGRDVFRGSPLWLEDPDVQLTYSAVRQWCRLHSPDTLLGAYTPDEMATGSPIDVTDKISGLAQRLKDAQKADTRGFDPAHAAQIIEGEVDEGADERHRDAVGDRERAVDREARAGHDPDKKAGAGDVKGIKKVVTTAAGQPAAPKKNRQS